MMILTTFALIALGLLLADLVTACVHWSVDNYASRDWPLIGPHYVAYAHDHHDNPLEILELSFIRCHWFILTFSTVMAVFLFAIDGLNTLTVSALIFGACTNLIHGWSHRSREANGPVITFFHRFGILQSPKHHDRHHSEESSNYALLTDFINPVLEWSGVFPFVEKCLAAIGLKQWWWVKPNTPKRKRTAQYWTTSSHSSRQI